MRTGRCCLGRGRVIILTQLYNWNKLLFRRESCQTRSTWWCTERPTTTCTTSSPWCLPGRWRRLTFSSGKNNSFCTSLRSPAGNCPTPTRLTVWSVCVPTFTTPSLTSFSMTALDAMRWMSQICHFMWMNISWCWCILSCRCWAVRWHFECTTQWSSSQPVRSSSSAENSRTRPTSNYIYTEWDIFGALFASRIENVPVLDFKHWHCVAQWTCEEDEKISERRFFAFFLLWLDLLPLFVGPSSNLLDCDLFQGVQPHFTVIDCKVVLHSSVVNVMCFMREQMYHFIVQVMFKLQKRSSGKPHWQPSLF